MKKAIEVKDLNFSYVKDIPVIKNVSFSIPFGSYTTIIGHNGSGKSTLAKLLATLLDKTSGTIYIDEIELTTDYLEQIRTKIGIVFQNPDNQFIGSTVRDDIAFGLENNQVDPAKMDQIIVTNANMVGMEDYLDREPSRLSGGQKQRVAIASVLAMTPKILILDEATSMLDPSGKDNINKLIKHLYQQEGLTILSVTHDMDEVLQSTDVLALKDGEVVYHGDPFSLFQNDDLLTDLQIEVPFMMELQKHYQQKGISIDCRKGIEGVVDDLWQYNFKK